MTHPRAARHFPQLQLSTDVASREEARPAELGNGHRTHYLPPKASGIHTVASANPLKLLGLTTGWESGHLGLRPARFRSFKTTHFPLREWLIAKAMGWKQYSRMLGLSRGYPYILYLKQLTAGMPGRTRLLPLRRLPISLSAAFFGGADDPAPAPSAVPDETDGPTESKGTCASSKSRRGQIRCAPLADSTK